MRTYLLSAVMPLCLCAGTAFAQPANDSCSNAQPISGFGQTAFDSTGATTDGPAIGCAAGNANDDVWFTWTSAFTGAVQVDLCTGTAHDTVLAIYSGAGCPAGAEIACNDDSDCGLLSKAQFNAVSGQQYTIRIGGYSPGDQGSGVVTIQEYIAPPPTTIVGPVVNPANGHTYYLLAASSWTQAEANAVILGGHLATVRNEEENIFIYNEVQRLNGAVRRAWIGLTDVAQQGTYVWTSGEPVTYTNWAAGEPNHAGGVEFYAQIPWYSTQWNDNRDLPSDDPCYGVVEIIPPSCAADVGSTGGTAEPDGVLDNNDFIVFIDYFFNANPLADRGTTGGVPGSDGQYDNNDFIVFIDQFFTGCN